MQLNLDFRIFYILPLLMALLIPSPIVLGFDTADEPNVLFVDPDFADGVSTFATIQAAIDAACDGDEICVFPATYKEILTITNKSLTIIADSVEEGERVIVDGCLMGSVVLNSNDGMLRQVVFEGFEFINGSFGAMELFNADICLVDVIINGNFSAFEGGGIFQLGGSLNFEGGCIKNNMSMSDGGGSFVSDGGSQTYNNVEVSDNICNGSGAAICAVDSGNMGSVTATNTVMDNNIAMEGDAGAFLGVGVNVNFDNVHVGGNDCPGVGGGAAFANCNVCNITGSTIKNNIANGAGGGLFCQDSNVCVIQSLLCNNTSQDASGGGFYSIGGNFNTCDSNYSGNSAGMNGGGILLVDLLEGNQTIKNTCIDNNIAELDGGGAALFGSSTSVELIKSKISNNRASNAGGVLVDNGTFKGVSSRFMSNNADENGGAVLGSGSSTVKFNGCIADGNCANVGGAFFVNSGSFFDLYNVNLILNLADQLAGAIAAAVDAELNGVNSIVYSNGVNNPIFESDPNSINFNFSVIEGGFAGNANTGLNPEFVNELGDDGMPGTGDENFCLSPNSSAIDAGSNADVLPDFHDLDWDGDFMELTPLDYKCNDRIVDGFGSGGGDFNLGGPIVDIGAIEFQGEAADVLLGDVNLDGEVNLLDVAPFIDVISQGIFQAEADTNQDGIVNLLDVGPFVTLLSNGS